MYLRINFNQNVIFLSKQGNARSNVGNALSLLENGFLVLTHI